MGPWRALRVTHDSLVFPSLKRSFLFWARLKCKPRLKTQRTMKHGRLVRVTFGNPQTHLSFKGHEKTKIKMCFQGEDDV